MKRDRSSIGVAMLLLFLTAVVGSPRAASGQSQGQGAAPVSSVLVHEFVSETADPADAWIGLGIAQAVAVDLGGFVGSHADAVDARVEGAFGRQGERLRITATLFDGPTDTVRTTLTLDGRFADLFGLQDELGRQLAALLSRPPHTPSAAITRSPPTLSASPTPGQVIERVRPADETMSGDPRAPASMSTETSSTDVDRAATAPSGRVAGTRPIALTIDGPSPPAPPDTVARDSGGRVTMRAIRLDAALEVDGVLDEPVYKRVAPVSAFVQQEPDEGAPAADQTEVWVMYDTDTLYVGARCWSSTPDRIVANEMQRDSWNMFGNDTFGVSLDTFYDRRNGFGFITNPIGGLLDALLTDERTFNMDWNTVWDVRTSRFDEGWTVEIAIPFRSLRYRPGPVQVWGINLQRYVASTNETSFLTPIPAADAAAGWYKLSAAATLVDLGVPQSGTRLEVKPYAIGDLTTDLQGVTPRRNDVGGDIGFDVKYGVTEGLTTDFTYNTDFAQVEADQQQVNLTRFSLFFPEKREFFLEGQGIFDFGATRTTDDKTWYFSGGQFTGTAPTMFFSRRIGLQSGRTVPIWAGGRLTGKTGPYSIGLLNVQTGEESVVGAEATNFSVVRVKRDILRRSAVGAVFTGRSVALDGNGSNQSYGVDGNFSFYDNLGVNAFLAKTQTPGVTADDLSYQAQLDYRGDLWGVTAERLAVGANFNPEVGFVRRFDFRRNFGALRFSPRPQSIAAVRKFAWESSIDYTTDGDGLLETRIRQGLFWTEFENGDQFYAGVTDNYERLQAPFRITPDVTIPVDEYSFVNTRLVYGLGTQRSVSGGVVFDRGGFWGGDRTSIGYFAGRIGLSPQLTIQPSLSFNWIDLPQGRFTTELVSARTTFHLSPRTFVAGLVQYNSSNDSISTNLRFRWEYRPGSELFVVYNEQRDTLMPRSAALENRAFVIKATRLFRF